MSRFSLARISVRSVLKLVVGALAVGVFVFGLTLHAHGVELVDIGNELRLTDEPRFAWRVVLGKHWQAIAMNGGVPAEGEPTAVTDAREGNGAGCPAGMVRVKGEALVDKGGEGSADIERLQDGACTEWLNKDFPARCQDFDAEKIARGVSTRETRATDFCIDRFEYPNVAGQNPIIVVTFDEAEASCKQANKRLCTESEWTFACEGEEARPYPYGYERDVTACVVDRPWRPFSESAMSPRTGVRAREEVDRLWQGEPSGSRGACRSPFGVYDMTGNVDEWTRSVRTTGYPSILKGGYWGPVRARCRPATRAHDASFAAYQQGFRCCAESDPNVQAPSPGAPSVPAAHEATPALAPTTDAQMPDAEALSSASSAPDAGVPSPRNRVNEAPALPADSMDDDELKALSRARTGLFRCAVGPGAALSASPGGGLVALSAALLFAVGAKRRRQARARAHAGASTTCRRA